MVMIGYGMGKDDGRWNAALYLPLFSCFVLLFDRDLVRVQEYVDRIRSMKCSQHTVYFPIKTIYI